MKGLREAIGSRSSARFAWCAGLLTASLAMAACAPFAPMSRSESSIRERMLGLTPIGSSTDHVRSIYEERLAPDCRWRDLSQQGYLPHHPLHTSLQARSGLLGCVGSYWNPASGPFTTYVFVRWLFDEQENLVEIEVRKDVDAL